MCVLECFCFGLVWFGLVCFVLFCFVLFCFVLFCFVFFLHGTIRVKLCDLGECCHRFFMTIIVNKSKSKLRGVEKSTSKGHITKTNIRTQHEGKVLLLLYR